MKKMLVTLFLMAVLLCISAVTVSAEDVFVSTDGVISDFTGTVYTSVESAIAAIGADGGTVYIEGTCVLPATPNTSAFSGKTLTFCGYNNSPQGNTAEIKCAAKAFLPTAPADIIFDNITVKVQDGEATETWIFPNGGSITFGSGCLYEHGYRASKNLDLRLHIGPFTGATKGGTINFNSSAAEYAEVGSLAGYIGGSTSNYTVNGDVTYNFNEGVFRHIYGGMRNGTTGFATLNGDVYYHFNGATLSSGYNLAAGNITNGVVNGNIFFNINGGNINRNLKMGSTGSVTDGKAAFGNMIVTLDGKSILQSGDGVTLTVSDGMLPTSHGERFLIINHNEDVAANSKVKLTVTATLEYYITAQGGTVTPVFEKSSGGTVGKFLGFEAVADTEGYVPVLEGKALTTNTDGYYDIPSSSSVQAVSFVSYTDTLPGDKFYVSADGEISGFSGTVYTSVESALAAMGAEGGTIFVEGSVVLPAKPATSAITDGELVFCGYNNTAQDNRVEFKCAMSAFLPQSAVDITFQSITVKVQDGNVTEAWISPNGGSITFEGSCLYEHGYRASKNLDLRLHMGFYNAANAGTVNFNAPVAEYAEVGSLAGYLGGTTSNFTTKGDVVYNFNAGIFRNIYGGMRNSTTGYAILNGDIYYNFGGATLSSGYELATGNIKNGVINGNIFFNIRGGEINRNLKIGSTSDMTEGMASFGNMVVTLDGKSIAQSGNNITLTVSDGKLPTSHGERFLIINHNEDVAANSKVKLTVTATLEYYITAQGGAVTPVFEKSSGGTAGKFLGFEAVADTEGLVPAINGIMLKKNSDGYYVINPSSELQTVKFADKSQLVSVITYSSALSGQEDITEEYGNGIVIDIPSCPFTPESGKIFSHWECDGKTYHEGDKINVSGDMVFTAVYTDENAANCFYVSADGSDSANGLTASTSFASLARAAVAAENSAAESVYIYVDGEYLYSDMGTHTKTVILKNGTLTGNISLKGNTVFDNVTLTGGAIYTNGHNAEFTEEVIVAENTKLVLGAENEATSDNTAILRGGSFSEIMLAPNSDTSGTFINICGADTEKLTLGTDTANANGVAVSYTAGKVAVATCGEKPAQGKVAVYTDGAEFEEVQFENAGFSVIRNDSGVSVTVLPDGTLAVEDGKYVYAAGDADYYYSVNGKISVSGGNYTLHTVAGLGKDYLPYPKAPEGKYFDTWQLVSEGHLKALFTEQKKINPYYVSQNGNDSNAGTSAVAPFKTLTAAVSAIGNADEGKVIIMDTVYWSDDASTCNVPEFPGTVTFEGLSADSVETQIIDYSKSTDANATTARLELRGNTVFKNISFRAHHYKSMYTNDHVLRLEGKIGYIKGTSGNPDLTITAGKYASDAKNVSIYLGAQCDIGTLYLGRNSSAPISGKLSVTVDGATVDKLMLGGNGAKLGDVDIVHISGTVGSFYTDAGNSSTEISGNLRIVKCNASNLTLENNANTQILGNSYVISCAEGVFVSPVGDVMYDVLNDITVRAENTQNGNVYYSSKGGTVGLPAGSYNITKADTDYYTNDGKVITVLSDIALAFDEYLYREDKNGENSIFTGWYYKDTENAPASGVTLPAGSVLEARYENYDPSGQEFGIIGLQIRRANSSVSQGLRFIVNKDKSFDGKFNITEYGAVIIPAEYLGSNELVKNGIYQCGEKYYRSVYTEGKKTFKTTESGLWYTLCLTGIIPENYNRMYTTRAYAECVTANGVPYTIYSDAVPSGLISVVRNNTPLDDEDKEVFEEIMSAWKNTYFGEGVTPYTTSYFDRAYTVNSTGVDVREIDISTGKNDGRVVQISMITDSHLNTSKPEQTDAMVKAMKCASFAEQIVLCGDNVESASSSANMALLQSVVWDKYPDTIAVLGNHEYFYPGSGSMDAVKEKVYDLWPHDPDYYSRLVGGKVLVVTADNARQTTYGESVYYFTEDKCDKLEADIAYARENGYVILFFHHVQMANLDKNFMANGRMYDLVTKNADVIKACFNGHGHTDGKSSLAATYVDENGETVSTTIPCYRLKSCYEPDYRGNLLFINVE